VTPHGFTVWLTGLSGAGKSTIAEILEAQLAGSGRLVERLDGDIVRAHLSSGLGFTKADRDENIDRIGWLASRFTRLGAAVVVSAISPYAQARQRARSRVERYGPFFEVFVDTPLDECARRDVKGLYAKARTGAIPRFTGISDPYEPPHNPSLRIVTAGEGPAASADRVLGLLTASGLV
jgi:adenylyl-sulfate kinase